MKDHNPLLKEWESKVNTNKSRENSQGKSNTSRVDPDTTRDDPLFKAHKKSVSLINDSHSALGKVEEEKDESIEFEIKQERKHRLIIEKQIEKLAKETPNMLDEKSKEIIKRINTKNLTKVNQLASLSQTSKQYNHSNSKSTNGFDSSLDKRKLSIGLKSKSKDNGQDNRLTLKKTPRQQTANFRENQLNRIDEFNFEFGPTSAKKGESKLESITSGENSLNRARIINVEDLRSHGHNVTGDSKTRNAQPLPNNSSQSKGDLQRLLDEINNEVENESHSKPYSPDFDNSALRSIEIHRRKKNKKNKNETKNPESIQKVGVYDFSNQPLVHVSPINTPNQSFAKYKDSDSIFELDENEIQRIEDSFKNQSLLQSIT